MAQVIILPEKRSTEVDAGVTLLKAGEQAGVEMEAGCFHCQCGTCAVEIVSGQDNLEPPSEQELDVLDGWNRDPEKHRLSCCARVRSGEVVIRRLE
jgi:ferredoxin